MVTARHVCRALVGCNRETGELAALAAFMAHLIATVQICGFVIRSFAPLALMAVGVVLTAFTIVVLPTELVASAEPRSVRDRWRWARTTYGWVGALAVVVGAMLVLVTAVTFAMPPRGYDTLWYHLPSVAVWLNADRITDAPFASFIGSYPANVELWWLHAAAFFGSARAAVIANVLPHRFAGYGHSRSGSVAGPPVPRCRSGRNHRRAHTGGAGSELCAVRRRGYCLVCRRGGRVLAA